MKKSLNSKKLNQNKNKNQNQEANTRFVVGRNSVFEVLRYAPKRIEKIYYSTDRGDKRNNEILNLAKQNNVNLEYAFKQDIQKLTKVENHQGFVAVVRDDLDHSLKSFINKLENTKEEKSKICVVAVDGVEDPHNLGTIFRASECFGASGVLLCKNRGVSITPATTKAAVGATELVDYAEVSNMLTAIRELKKHGFWCVVADVSKDAISLNDFESPNKAVLIVGAEGTGVKKILKEEADFIVKIPQVGKIDSLNVSQATAVILYQMMCL
ncbi:MAG: 23S rRNA (guanosine(2251)-2'-O)-methyltransferase RlmB [Bdellovibrionota bacterium]